MSDDPICTITDDMLEAGVRAVSRLTAEGTFDIDQVVTLAFMAMLTEMEGGKVLFAYEGEDSPTIRFRQKGVQ